MVAATLYSTIVRQTHLMELGGGTPDRADIAQPATGSNTKLQEWT